MLYRLVQPVKRSGSSIPQFVQRIPADVHRRAVGRTITFRLGSETTQVTITAAMVAIRFSLRTRDPGEVKVRQAQAAVMLETVWAALRHAGSVTLSHREATALAGEVYRAWSDERRERRVSVTQAKRGAPFVRDFTESPEEAEGGFAAAIRRLLEAAKADGLEGALGAIVDGRLLARGIAELEPSCRPVVLEAFHLALLDAFAHRQRNASGDYAPDPKATRFPEWDRSPDAPPPPAPSAGKTSLSGLLEGWWTEAQATGRKPSTYDSYRHTVSGFAAFLEHDDAGRITPEDVVRYKDHRLASLHPRTGKPVSPKTVKDSDLAGLKTVFGWAVANRKLPANPAAGITIKLGKAPKLRSKGFTDDEARAILRAASAHAPGGGELPQTAAAKRWVPWLCAYTGARVGEMAQLRKQDVRREGEHWVLRITPEAGTVKTNEAREVVLHPHLVEMGFPAFATAAPAGHLFLKLGKDGDVRGPWRGLKNRLAEFARAIVPDPGVAPNHGWRHRFKTVGREVGVAPSILDAIQGQAPATVADSYGDFSVPTIAAAIARLPRIEA